MSGDPTVTDDNGYTVLEWSRGVATDMGRWLPLDSWTAVFLQ